MGKSRSVGKIGIPGKELKRNKWNGFYDLELNVHVFHLARDSAQDGEIWVYRYKRKR